MAVNQKHNDTERELPDAYAIFHLTGISKCNDIGRLGLCLWARARHEHEKARAQHDTCTSYSKSGRFIKHEVENKIDTKFEELRQQRIYSVVKNLV